MQSRRSFLAAIAGGATALTLPRAVRAEPDGKLIFIETEFQGELRSYYRWIPSTVDKHGPTPLVMAIHGGFGEASDMYATNDWARTLHDHAVYGLFPNAMNAGTPGVDDHEFLVHILEQTYEDLPIDRSRVYLTGFSGGGAKSYYMAAAGSEHVAAVAPVAATIGLETDDPDPVWSPYTHGSLPVSIIHIHGARDTRIPIDGRPLERDKVSMRDGLETWADYLGAEPEDRLDMSAMLPPDVSGYRWEVPRDGHEVMGLIDADLEHTWPSWANEVIMAFFARVPRR